MRPPAKASPAPATTASSIGAPVKARGVVLEDDDLAAGLGWVTTVEVSAELDGGLVTLVVTGAVWPHWACPLQAFVPVPVPVQVADPEQTLLEPEPVEHLAEPEQTLLPPAALEELLVEDVPPVPPVVPPQVVEPEQTFVTLLADGLGPVVQVEEPEQVLLPPAAPEELFVDELPPVPLVVPVHVADPEQTLEPGLVVQLDEPEQTLLLDEPELVVVQFDEPEQTLLTT